MTSIMHRIQSGDIETAREQFLRARGSKPPCCVEHNNLTDQSKCDQIGWLPETEFQNRCQECQLKIARLLGVK